MCIRDRHYWVNTSTYLTNKINERTPITYYFNRPKYRNSTSIEFNKNKSWNASFQYNYESGFEANLGVFNGRVPPKNTFDMALSYQLRNDLECALNVSNLFNSEYQSYPFMPIIGRTITGTISYRL